MPVLLLDRDGVLIARRHYDYRPEHMVPLPGVIDGLSRFRDAGYRFFIVSNQSGVGRKLQTMESVIACNQKLSAVLADFGITIVEAVFCPHRSEDGCNCRKPKLGMWEALKEHHQLSPDECIMVGDRAGDIQLGMNIGCKTALIGEPTEKVPEPTYKAKDLAELASIVLTPSP